MSQSSTSLPKIEQNISNVELDSYLAQHLQSETLLKLKAVEMAVYFFMDKTPTPEQFHQAYNKIYEFYNEKLHQRSVPE